MAEYLFKRNKTPNTQIDILLDLWAASLYKATGGDANCTPPFSDHKDLHSIIDSTELGDAPWDSFTVQFDGEIPEHNVLSWMDEKYEVWCRDPRVVMQNMLSNPDFDGEFDYSPFREYRDAKRVYRDFMSGNWAWEQAVRHD